MNPEDVQQVIEYLRGLAQPALEKGWDVMYRQVVLYRAWDVIVAVLLLVALIVSILYWKKFVPVVIRVEKIEKYKRSDEEDSALDIAQCVLIITGVVLVVAVPIILANLFAISNFLINPDWQVMKIILSLVK